MKNFKIITTLALAVLITTESTYSFSENYADDADVLVQSAQEDNQVNTIQIAPENILPAENQPNNPIEKVIEEQEIKVEEPVTQEQITSEKISEVVQPVLLESVEKVAEVHEDKKAEPVPTAIVIEKPVEKEEIVHETIKIVKVYPVYDALKNIAENIKNSAIDMIRYIHDWATQKLA